MNKSKRYLLGIVLGLVCIGAAAASARATLTPQGWYSALDTTTVSCPGQAPVTYTVTGSVWIGYPNPSSGFLVEERDPVQFNVFPPQGVWQVGAWPVPGAMSPPLTFANPFCQFNLLPLTVAQSRAGGYPDGSIVFKADPSGGGTWIPCAILDAAGTPQQPLAIDPVAYQPFSQFKIGSWVLSPIHPFTGASTWWSETATGRAQSLPNCTFRTDGRLTPVAGPLPF